MQDRKKILIVDDNEMNRAILSDMLGSDFDIIEAGNGEEAICILHKQELDISLMLLDIVMPVLDGFETLEVMKKHEWIYNIPIIMISAETSKGIMQKAYDMGVLDFITRPFDATIVRRRVQSTMLITTKQKELEKLVINQIYEKEKGNKLMIAILSHLVEFRNGESGMHVLHIRMITELLLRALIKKTSKYGISSQDISLICNAAALHDIGKILIPEAILNKPSKLTKEEFGIMKEHSEKGADILKGLDVDQSEPLIKAGYEICRWHHERYDGNGYPDKLKGDEIPITAQIVAIADVYDALTNKRVYKKAYTHEEAIKMIKNGECGVFNPELLETFMEVSDDIKINLGSNLLINYTKGEVVESVSKMTYGDRNGVSERTLTLLEHERTKYKFFAELSQEVQFEYVENPEMIQISEWGANYLKVDELIYNPKEDRLGKEIFVSDDFEEMLNMFRNTTKENPNTTCTYMLTFDNKQRWCKIIARSMWEKSDNGEDKYVGAIGKIVDINDSMEEMNLLQKKATHDSLTELLNHATAKVMITNLISKGKENYVLCLFDLDHFKQANDTYGHLFGDEVLKCVSDTLKECIRNDDISARMGGDEFLICMSYKDKDKLPEQINRIYSNICRDYKNFTISISMGISYMSKCEGTYDKLFDMADKALYDVKRHGRGSYKFSEG